MRNQQNDELHEIVFGALCKAATAVSSDELIALCHMCGIAYKDVLEDVERDMEPHKRTGWYEKQLEAAEHERERKLG